MEKYMVIVTHTVKHYYKVDADNREEAIREVNEGFLFEHKEEYETTYSCKEDKE